MVIFQRSEDKLTDATQKGIYDRHTKIFGYFNEKSSSTVTSKDHEAQMYLTCPDASQTTTQYNTRVPPRITPWVKWAFTSVCDQELQ